MPAVVGNPEAALPPGEPLADRLSAEEARLRRSEDALTRECQAWVAGQAFETASWGGDDAPQWHGGSARSIGWPGRAPWGVMAL